MLLIVGLFSCQNKKSQVIENKSSNIVQDSILNKEFVKISATEIPDNMIKLISQDWMLITAGNKDKFNTMTASWGTLGELWGKNVSIIFVRDTRYTYEFLNNNDSYTLAFFTDDYRTALQICGTKSGRDCDKVAEAGLTPRFLESGNVAFEEARLIIECKKLYSDPFKKENFISPDFFEQIYSKDTSVHTMYVGEILNVWIKK
ncbi:MAG: flavin reductase [Bacteroidales bacterium]|jgi:flavin reductase (DIM6/NTAB) family NADH-FMN oxidoreductase RutF|nr:flavin reductase [Bacteroidales bacterium]